MSSSAKPAEEAVRRVDSAPVLRTEGVTLVVTRKVKPGKDEAYKDWLTRLHGAVDSMPGFVGAMVQAPVGESREYTSIYRFDSVEALRRFEGSSERRRLVAEISHLVEADAVWKRYTGCEFWFAPPAGAPVPQPSRFRMAVLLTIVVFSLVVPLGALFDFLLPFLPKMARIFVSIASEIFLMTYVLMPYLTRHLTRWIYPDIRLRAGMNGTADHPKVLSEHT
ncbi:MAG: antibiotic biosynthesis monooxygenase [Myxococcales bacterium]|nr:antibiotic biosynthesis monooxygenase [Myxococcales bacterium]